MQPPVTIVALPAKSLKKSFDFYRTALELPLVAPRPDGSMPEPVELRLNPGAHLMLIPADGFRLALGENEVAPAGTSECVIGLACTSRDEVDTTLQRALASGASLVSPAVEQPWGYAATVRDLDGHTLMLTTTS